MKENNNIFTTPLEDGFYINNKTNKICKVSVMNQNKTVMNYLKKAFKTAKENDSAQKEYENMVSKYARIFSDALDKNDYESETVLTKITFHDVGKVVCGLNYAGPIEKFSPDEIKEMPELLCRIIIQQPWSHSSVFKSIQKAINPWDLEHSKIRTDVFNEMKHLGYISGWAYGPKEELIFERIIPNPYYYDECRKSPTSVSSNKILEEK